MFRTLRRITVVGNSVGVTLPRSMLKACGLARGKLVEVQRAGVGLLIIPAKAVPAPRPVHNLLKAGLIRIYGARLKGVYFHGSLPSDLRALIVLDHAGDYGAEIERTGDLISRLSLSHAANISRIFLPERDWISRRREGAWAS